MAHVIAETKGRILGLNPDLMLLLDNTTGTELVRATRADGQWTIHADGHDDLTAADRNTAITAMIGHAQTATGAENYTGTIQAGLRDQP